MAIHPLPQFEADLDALRVERNAEQLREAGATEAEIERLSDDDRAVYKRLKAPKTLVVRFGVMKLVGEFPYDGATKPGCGSKLVVRTHRGVEIGEMLTSTCPNAGCSKSVTRKEMLEYIENSGGRQYPFRTDGKVLRIATAEDMDAQAALEQSRHGLKMRARAHAERLLPHAKIVDAEPILGGERLTVYYASEQRLETRALHAALQSEFKVRVDLRHVGARDEARITADYERCGQYCCCKNFLKVLKPVSMRSAKVQKATLDPLKISGRCGRLMCCLRYEDETYEDLRKRLPRRKSRVGTPEGDGVVVDTQILTQLALVRLDDTGTQVAIPVEELTQPGQRPPPKPAARERDGRPPKRGAKARAAEPGDGLDEARPSTPARRPDAPTGDQDNKPRKTRRRRRRRGTQRDPERRDPDQLGADEPDADRGNASRTPTTNRPDGQDQPEEGGIEPEDSGRPSPDAGDGNAPDQGGAAPTGGASGETPPPRRKKRRRRRRRPPGSGGASSDDAG